MISLNSLRLQLTLNSKDVPLKVVQVEALVRYSSRFLQKRNDR